jgi:hypothetical protein
MEEKFGRNPSVGIRLKVYHNEEIIYPGVGYDDTTWYEEVPMGEKKPTRVKDNSTTEGYQ